MVPVNNYQLFHQPNIGQIFVFVGTQIMTYPKISSDFRGIEIRFSDVFRGCWKGI